MAAPTDVVMDSKNTGVYTDDVRVQLNNIVVTLRLLAAKLDADAGVTDTNYAALLTDAAVGTAPAKLVHG